MISEKLQFGLVLAAGVILPGVASSLLSQAGYGSLGTVVWALGYATAVLVIWFVWIRPLDLSGPSGEKG